MQANRRAFSFDAQAWSFDRRAGLPTGAAETIAEAICEITGASQGDRLLEIGVGTGEIGSAVAARYLSYLGLEVSLPMLALFGDRLRSLAGTRVSAIIARANANQLWPVRHGAVDILFFSRSAHLLDEPHLVAECLRVGRPAGCWLLLGGVRRERESIHSRMRREMHGLLAEHGVKARGSGRTWRRLAAVFEERGGRALSPVVATAWQVREAPTDSLASWHNVAGLAGRAVESRIKEDVLRRLTLWAEDHYGDLEAYRESTERYQLMAIRLPT